MRLGLKNYSNTNMMSAGAACGPGIYLAQDASTSFGYVGVMKGWNNSIINGDTVGCIALCEIVDLRSDKTSKVHVHGTVFVVEDETLVMTR